MLKFKKFKNTIYENVIKSKNEILNSFKKINKCRISNCQIEKVMSQNELAKALGINPSAITKWLNGERVPDIQNIPLVCELLNISLNPFFGINEDRIITQSELKYIETIEKHPELKAILDKYTKI